jgi:hypothetical protein
VLPRPDGLADGGHEASWRSSAVRGGAHTGPPGQAEMPASAGGSTLDVTRYLDDLGRVIQERHTAKSDPATLGAAGSVS